MVDYPTEVKFKAIDVPKVFEAVDGKTWYIISHVNRNYYNRAAPVFRRVAQAKADLRRHMGSYRDPYEIYKCTANGNHIIYSSDSDLRKAFSAGVLTADELIASIDW